MTQTEPVTIPEPYVIDPATISEAFVITVANQKGGSGKTTVSMNLAAALANRGYKVLVADADKQGSAMLWADNNESETGFPATMVSLAEHTNIHKEVGKLAKQYHFIVIDCPPAADSPASIRVMPVSDLVLVPLVPSPIDMWATTALKRAIEQAQTVNPDLQARIVMNNCQLRTNIAQDVIELAKNIGIPLLETLIKSRVVYRALPVEGHSIYDQTGSATEEALAEIEAVTNEVLRILNSPPTE